MIYQFLSIYLLIYFRGIASECIAPDNDTDNAPEPAYGYDSSLNLTVDEEFYQWNKKNSNVNLWELTGLYQGDIMTYDIDSRNGMVNKTVLWPNATVPLFIVTNQFTTKQLNVIYHAINELHLRTVVKFRPYEVGDVHWVVIKSVFPGCWSSIGMFPMGQVLNLQSPQCIVHGIVIHELLHVLGFYHQHSTYNRDDYVEIIWHNIHPLRWFNFYKENKERVSNYGVNYDYRSVMHYSRYAFSNNGHATIVPKHKNARIGQRDGLSLGDICKVNNMYSNVQRFKSTPVGYAVIIIHLIIQMFLYK